MLQRYTCFEILFYTQFLFSHSGKCNVKADIVLLVDGSKSVSAGGRSSTGDSNYYKHFVFEMLKDLINDFDAGDDNVHMGCMFFGNEDITKTINEVRNVLLVLVLNNVFIW